MGVEPGEPWVEMGKEKTCRFLQTFSLGKGLFQVAVGDRQALDLTQGAPFILQSRLF